nr:MAG TPA: hypothetical protein [Caudoviricetes sp.]
MEHRRSDKYAILSNDSYSTDSVWVLWVFGYEKTP